MATKISAPEAAAFAEACARRGTTRSSLLHELLSDFLGREQGTIDLDLTAEEAPAPTGSAPRR